MDYEYVALTWQTHNKKDDDCFMTDYHRLCDAGWEVSLDAVFEPQRAGGACIMRRPKSSCKPECCVEEEKTLVVLPIYYAYLKKMCWDSEQALRLTFIEVQCYMGRALTWPNK